MAFDAAQASLHIALKEYEVGATSYTQVLAEQQQLEQIHIALIEVQTRRLIDTTALYQVMGGESFVLLEQVE